MPLNSALVQTVTTTGDGVRPGDVIAVGGIPHAVEDVRELVGGRKRLQFTDGNGYVLGRSMTIEVTRVYAPVHGRPHTSLGGFRPPVTAR